MFFLIPFIAGAAGTGYWWYSSEQKEEKTLSDELFEVLKPVLIILLVVLFIRWAYNKGTVTENQPK